MVRLFNLNLNLEVGVEKRRCGLAEAQTTLKSWHQKVSKSAPVRDGNGSILVGNTGARKSFDGLENVGCIAVFTMTGSHVLHAFSQAWKRALKGYEVKQPHHMRQPLARDDHPIAYCR